MSGFRGFRAKASLQKLGRLKNGQMNKTEATYSSRLEEMRLAGLILWWKFEGVKLRLADNTFLTMDFGVVNADGLFELHDVKGSMAIFSDDAKVKVKVAAEMYPFVFKIVVPRAKKNGGGWEVVEL